MDIKKNEFKNYLLKFENIEIIYISPTNQYWGISTEGVKKCIVKKVIDRKIFEDFLKKKKIISYKESKLFKKKVSIDIQDIRKQRLLDIKKKKFKNALLKFENIKIIYITSTNQYWGISTEGVKKCIFKKVIDRKILSDFLVNKKIVSVKEGNWYQKGIHKILQRQLIIRDLKKVGINLDLNNQL